MQYGDSLGRTPLIWAVLETQPNVVKFFVSNEALVNITNFKGQTPLHLAISTHKIGLAKILMLHGGIIALDLNEKETQTLSAAQKDIRNDICEQASVIQEMPMDVLYVIAQYIV